MSYNWPQKPVANFDTNGFLKRLDPIPDQHIIGSGLFASKILDTYVSRKSRAQVRAGEAGRVRNSVDPRGGGSTSSPEVDQHNL